MLSRLNLRDPRVSCTFSQSSDCSGSPAKKKARLSSEGTTLNSLRQPLSRPRPNAEARKRRQLAIAAALSQPQDAPSSSQLASAPIPSTPPQVPFVRDGLTNATNLVLTPKRDQSGQSEKDGFTAVLSAQASINASQDDGKDVFGVSQSSSASVNVSTNQTLSNVRVNEEEVKAHNLFVSSPPIAPLRETSPLDQNNRPVTPPPPSDITRVEPGVFFTASRRRLDLSASALAEARQFTARVDLDLPPEVDPCDEMAVISAIKSSHFQSSQRVRKPSISFHPPLRRRIQAEAPSTPVRPPSREPPPDSVTRDHAPSQSTPLRHYTSGFQTPTAKHPNMSPTPVIDVVRSLTTVPTSIASSQRSLGMTARRNGTPVSARNKPFVTPFKAGYRPGSSSTPQRTVASVLTTPNKTPMHAILPQPKFPPVLPKLALTPSVGRDEDPRTKACFDIRKPHNALPIVFKTSSCSGLSGKGKSRLSMKDFGLSPGEYSVRDLLRRGMYVRGIPCL